MAERLAYASPAWRAAMHEILAELVEAHRANFPEADFTMCEVVTDVPPDGGTTILAARITGEGVTFFDEEIAADVLVKGDHEAMLPAARLHRKTATQQELAAQGAHSLEMARAGRVSFSGDMRKAPKALLRVLGEMHDRLADITA